MNEWITWMAMREWDGYKKGYSFKNMIWRRPFMRPYYYDNEVNINSRF